MSRRSSHETEYPFPVISHRDVSSLSRSLSFSLAIIAMVFTSLIAAFLALISLFSTGYFLPPKPYEVTLTSERMLLKQGIPTPLFLASFIFLAFTLLCVTFLWIKFLPDFKIGKFIFIYTLSASLLWVLSLNLTGNSYSYPDSKSLIDSASSIVAGRFSDFSIGGAGQPSFYAYYSWYPFQAGALFWFVLIFSIFGINNLIAFLIINALAVGLTIWSIWKLGCFTGLSSTGRRILALLLTINFPLILSTGFIYTNCVGLCCAMLCTLASATAIQQNSKLKTIFWMIIAFIVGGIAMMIKGTEILFILSISAIFIISSLRKRMYALIPFTLLLFLLSKWSTNLPIILLQHFTGQQFGNGLPQLSWIAIGLSRTDDPNWMPGWWTGSAINIYQITQGDQGLQKAFAKTTIWSSLIGFLSEPRYAWSFFFQKIASEWSEPTYQSLYYSSFNQRGTDSLIWRILIGKTGAHRLISFQNVYQSTIYFFAAFGLMPITKIKKMRSEQFETMCMIALIIAAGFLCFVFWEAKSIYVLPFAALMTIPASHGLQHIGEGASLVYRKIRRKSEMRPGE